MKKLLIFATLSLLTALAADYKEVRFTKVCKRCGKISHEIQMYAYNSWTDTWQKSWRSDTNRPGCCEECYFELQPRVKFLEKPMNAYTIGSYDTTSDGEDNSNYKLRWWNNGSIEKLKYSKPLGIGWKEGRLKR